MFDVPLDPWQYRLSADPASDGREFGPFGLETGADIGCVTMSDGDGKDIGWLIGFPMDLVAQKVVDGPLRVSHVLTEDRDGFAQAVLSDLGGRFLWCAVLNGQQRIYLDSSALVPCVYDPDLRMAGSTAHALLDDAGYEARFDQARYEHFDVARAGWFPAGLTAHRGVERLLPNHYLDLQDWQAKRHWPVEFDVPDTPQAIVAKLIEQVQAQFKALIAGDKTVVLTLTAGRDTRILLACARPFLDQIRFATVVGEDQHAVDTVMARKIAAEYDLDFIELPRTRATQEAHDIYIRRGAHCVGDANAWYFPSVAPIAQDHVLVGGAGGEIGRAFYWRGSDRPETELTVSGLTGRMGFAQHPELTMRLEHWLNSLGTSDMLRQLDLAYVEQRMGPWGAAQFCNDPTIVRIPLFVTRRITELLLSLPPEWKRNETLADEVMRQAWPELARYKFNTLGPMHDLLGKFHKLRSDPGVVLRKIRKRFSR